MTERETLRLLSFGAGAIGTFIGGSLALQGHEVSFVERPEMVAQLKEKPLRLNLHGVEHEVMAAGAYSSIKEALAVGEYDVVLFALKAYDTDAALASIKPLANKIPPVLCLQNGVDNEGNIASVLGKEKVISCTITSAIGRRDIGDIVLEKSRGMGIARGLPLTEKLATELNKAGIRTELFECAEDMKWSKMITNLLSNAGSAILGIPPGEVFANKYAFRIEIAQIVECLKVMNARGINVVDLPGVPVKALAFAIRFLPTFIKQPILSWQVGGGRGEKMPSFYLDLQNGRGKSEVSYLNGAVSRFGKEVGVNTPVNNFLSETLNAMVAGELPQDAYLRNPEKLYRAIFH